jgi:hypothetical protein
VQKALFRLETAPIRSRFGSTVVSGRARKNSSRGTETIFGIAFVNLVNASMSAIMSGRAS